MNRVTQNVDGIPEETLIKVQAFLEPFRLSLEKLQDVSARLKMEMDRGLGRRSHCNASVKMLPTFVSATPDGTEKGNFLALDLGGTNLRVFHVHLKEGEKEVNKMDSQDCKIPQEMMLEPGEQLFEYIATFMREFLDSKGLLGQNLPLGFTFSFPCHQTEISKSILIRWTKDFQCPGVVGEDVVKLLKKAISRQKYNVGTVVILNDTVGTLINGTYEDRRCMIGLIIGTGTNACYMEEMRNVKRVEGDDGLMCINMEWGGFGDDGSLDDIRTKFDKDIDENSFNRGQNIFEKMISGMYLGEIVRLLLVKLTQEKLLFGGRLPKTLMERDSFKTEFMSEIEKTDGGLQNAQRILKEPGTQSNKGEVDEVDALIVRLVCDTVSSRSARLCAAALATVANRIRDNRGQEQLEVTVAVDGSVIMKHPNLKLKLQEAVRDLAPQCDITFLASKECSGKGAALVAAMAHRMQSRLLEDEEEEERN